MAKQEDEIKDIFKNYFEKRGWKITALNKGNKRGVDFEAKKDNLCWKIEVKSEYKSQQTTNSSFLQVWGEILQRMDSCDTYYGVAFPDTQLYRQLCEKITSEAKKRIKVFILFVKIEKHELKDIDLISWNEEDKNIPVPLPFKNFGLNSGVGDES